MDWVFTNLCWTFSSGTVDVYACNRWSRYNDETSENRFVQLTTFTIKSSKSPYICPRARSSAKSLSFCLESDATPTVQLRAQSWEYGTVCHSWLLSFPLHLSVPKKCTPEAKKQEIHLTWCTETLTGFEQSLPSLNCSWTMKGLTLPRFKNRSADLTLVKENCWLTLAKGMLERPSLRKRKNLGCHVKLSCSWRKETCCDAKSLRKGRNGSKHAEKSRTLAPGQKKRLGVTFWAV